MKIEILRLSHAIDLPLPAYATEGSAGLDLLAAVDADTELSPGARAAIPTGIALAVPHGYEAQVRPRSGLALNHGDTPFPIKRGTKIAQMVIARHEQAHFVEVSELGATERGTGGFGSTGIHIKQN